MNESKAPAGGGMAVNRENPGIEPWEVLNSREIFVAMPWVRLSVQQVRLPNGRVVDDYYQIKLPEFVVIFAQMADGRVIVEQQYKHGVRECTLVLPAGLIQEGEDPLVCAQRELLEETGYVASEWQPLGRFVMNGNYGCGRAHLFMARDAQRVTEPDSGDLEDMEILLLKPSDLLEALRNGEIILASNAAAIALATNPLFTSPRRRNKL